MKLLNCQKDSDIVATDIVERPVSINNLYVNIKKFSHQERKYYHLLTSRNVAFIV